MPESGKVLAYQDYCFMLNIFENWHKVNQFSMNQGVGDSWSPLQYRLQVHEENKRFTRILVGDRIIDHVVDSNLELIPHILQLDDAG